VVRQNTNLLDRKTLNRLSTLLQKRRKPEWKCKCSIFSPQRFQLKGRQNPYKFSSFSL